jgi:hypothetical protein
VKGKVVFCLVHLQESKNKEPNVLLEFVVENQDDQLLLALFKVKAMLLSNASASMIRLFVMKT